MPLAIIGVRSLMVFFFNLSGAVYDPGVEGYELTSKSAARIEAVKFAGELLRDRPDALWDGEELRVEVTDKNRRALFTIIVHGEDVPGALKFG